MCSKIIILLIVIFVITISSVNIDVIDTNIKKDIYIEVKGEVIDEGLYILPQGSKINDLLDHILLKEDADTTSLSRLKTLHNNEIIYIPKKVIADKVSINKASISELACLPGIGKSIAKKIIDYRNEYGSFINLEDLMNISGIGNKKYENIKKYICL